MHRNRGKTSGGVQERSVGAACGSGFSREMAKESRLKPLPHAAPTRRSYTPLLQAIVPVHVTPAIYRFGTMQKKFSAAKKCGFCLCPATGAVPFAINNLVATMPNVYPQNDKPLT